MSYLFLASVAILFIVPVTFVWNKVYDDGFIGRLALIGISFSSFIFALKIFSRGMNHPWPETMLMMTSFAVFLVWHLFRFHRRVLMSKDAEEGKVERRKKHGHRSTQS